MELRWAFLGGRPFLFSLGIGIRVFLFSHVYCALTHFQLVFSAGSLANTVPIPHAKVRSSTGLHMHLWGCWCRCIAFVSWEK